MSDDLSETEQRLRTVLKPVEPSPAFRALLHDRLVRAARKERSPVQIASAGDRRREVIVGAALLSVAGALVYLWRSHTLQDAPRLAAALLQKRSAAAELPVTAA